VFYQESLGKPSVAIYSLTNVAIVVGAGIIVFWVTVMMARTRLVEIPPSESGPRKQLHPFLVVIFVSFVAAFMLAIPSKPPLPMVVIDIKDKDNNAVGRLLAHTDGYWYVFQERRYQPKSELTAIPDDEVKRAWVSKAQ
jgi:hypothetical protein